MVVYLDYDPMDTFVENSDYCKYGHYEEGNPHLPECSNELAWGRCDFCDETYYVADGEDHCTECGNCNEHCVCTAGRK